ncbi:MAG TPA: transglycosylase domain-containing protein, partial [Methyloceanibacter sp.]|nr:transglycosylase domain-containing protein [Methyloceanibacter sp.]
MRRKKHPWLRRAFRLISVIAAVILLSIIAFRFINPPITPVMAMEKLRGHTLRHEWLPLRDMSPQLPLAAIASEDGRFCAHWGVDWSAVNEAIKEGGGFGAFRGASTIPMQTAKNLYLWSGRSYVRKAIEVPLAYVMSV